MGGLSSSSSSLQQQQQDNDEDFMAALLHTLDPVVNITVDEGNNGSSSTSADTYDCPCCSFTTIDKEILDFHALEKHPDGESTFVCKDCEFSSQKWLKYSRHLNKHLIGDRTYTCSSCSYRTKTKGSFDSHMRTHTGEKPYGCSYCSYRSAQRVHLKIHLRTHTGEKPFACPYCPYHASQNSSLKRHIQTQHGPARMTRRRYNKLSAVQKHNFDMSLMNNVTSAETAQFSAFGSLPPFLTSSEKQNAGINTCDYEPDELNEMTLNKQLQQIQQLLTAHLKPLAKQNSGDSDPNTKQEIANNVGNERMNEDANQ